MISSRIIRGAANHEHRGKLLTLNTKDIDQLGDIIVGLASDTADSEIALSENTSAILKRKGDNISDITGDLHKQLTAKGIKQWKFTISDVYSFDSDAKDNVKVWFEAKKLDQTVRDKIKSVGFLSGYFSDVFC